MKYSQVNVKMPTVNKQVLIKKWKKFCEGKGEPMSFNAYLASFWKDIDLGPDPLTPKVPIGSKFVDNRGVIQNILNNGEIRAVAFITSKKGVERSNHWHKTDWHYLYVVSGSMQYYERSLDNKYCKDFLVSEGEMVFTAPGLVHKTLFLEDTVLLSINNYIDHDADTVSEKY